MPKFYLKIIVREMTPEVEEDLEKSVIIKGRVDRFNLYLAEANVNVVSQEEISQAYEKLRLDLLGKKYVSKIERAAELKALRY